MRISFDFGGTLHNHPDLEALLLTFYAAGHDIYILSGVKSEADKQARRDFVDGKFYKIKEFLFTKVDGRGGRQQKADKCLAHSIDFHFDNDRGVAAAIRETTKGKTKVIVVNGRS